VKKHWIILFVVLAGGLLLIGFYNARPKKIQDTPQDIPGLREIVPPGTSTARGPQILDESQVPVLLRPTPLVRTATERLFARSCEHGTDNCRLQAIYDFVRRNIEFSERTPETAYVRSPAEVLLYGKADALELAVLLASMQRAAGFRTEVVRTPSGSRTWTRVYHANTSIMIDPTNQGSPVMGSRVSLRGDEIVYN
jgi:transglutaminase-like putative cysteine protease